MRQLFNEIQNAETANGDDFCIHQVFYNLLGEVIHLDGLITIEKDQVKARWNSSGTLMKIDLPKSSVNLVESEHIDKYSLFIRKLLTSDTKQLHTFWSAITYYLLSRGLKNEIFFKLIDDNYIAFKLRECYKELYKPYCRSSHQVAVPLNYIEIDLPKQPYYIHVNSVLGQKLLIKTNGFDLVCNRQLLNLDVDFEALKGAKP